MTVPAMNIRTAFIAVMMPKERQRLQNESLGLFGVNLASGISLFQTLDISRTSMPWQPYRSAMNAIFEGLEQGLPLIEALKSPQCKLLPAFALVILASDLTDVEKGNIIHLKYSKAGPDPSFMVGAMAYPFIQLFITFQTCLALVLFVLPQFKEIFLGMRVPLPYITRVLMSLSDAMVTWWFLVVPSFLLSILVIVGVMRTAPAKRALRRLFGTHHLEFAEILRILGDIPPEHIDRVLRTVSLQAIMPLSFDMIGGFRDALGSGRPVDAVLLRYGFDPQVAWMVRLALEGKGTRENFTLAAELIVARASGTLKRRAILVDCLSPLLVALFVSFILISVFLPLIALLEHI